MSHIKLLLLLTSLSCLSLHCKKESELDKLPPATAIGANTFGCLLNGKAWPMGSDGYKYYDVSYNAGRLHIKYGIKNNQSDFLDKERVSFTTNKIHNSGVYFIPYSIDTDFFSVDYHEMLYLSGVAGVPNGIAYIAISQLDTVNSFVSGTFEFSVYDITGKAQMKVSSGRFDFHY